MDINQVVLKYLHKNWTSKILSENLIYSKAHQSLSVLIFFWIFGASGSIVYGQEKTGANDSKTNEGSSGGSSAVWAVPAEQKVRPNDAAETANLVWSQEKKKITVAGAGNEHVPFQVVITVPVPPGSRPKAPDGFFIKASNLTSKGGKTIPASQINF